ncbi:PAN domain-containing protein [Sorangium sp. So ce281]|uniref:PAN domain-containing protein n=1 Tax=unclassified Sorangium TaxID=2621164 RepID=UPI003F5DDB5D
MKVIACVSTSVVLATVAACADPPGSFEEGSVEESEAALYGGKPVPPGPDILTGPDWDTDRPGLDYWSIKTDSAYSCRDACAQDSGCAAWSYYLGFCNFKHGIAFQQRKAGVASGTVAPRYEWSIVHEGGETFQTLQVSSLDACRLACLNTPYCTNFTMDLGSPNGLSGVGAPASTAGACWLKHGYGSARWAERENCVSLPSGYGNGQGANGGYFVSWTTYCAERFLVSGLLGFTFFDAGRPW